MAQALPPFLPISALAVELDAFVSIAAASQAGFADARATFECSLPRVDESFGFFVLAGLEPLFESLERLKLKSDDLAWLESAGMFDSATFERLASMRFACDLDAPLEGTVVFPGEPVLTVEGPFWQAQLIASLVKGALGSSTIAASRAARLVQAAGGADIVESGSVAAHRLGGNPLIARAAFVGGATATTNALAARRYRIPVRASMSASYALGAPDIEKAILAWSRTMRDRPSVKLDPRSPLTSLQHITSALRRRGAPTFAKGDVTVEISGGDLVDLARVTIETFRNANLPEPTLVASGDLDERRIAEIVQRKVRYASYVVDDLGDPPRGWSPAYDLVAIERDGQWAPRIRIGDDIITSSDPGRKVLVRYVDEQGAPVADVAHGRKERFGAADDIRFVERASQMKTRLSAHASAPLANPVMRQGRRVETAEPARTIRERAIKSLKALPERFRRLTKPDVYPVGATKALVDVKEDLLSQAREA